MVDSGASHSFISADLVSRLAIPTDLSAQHKIEVGNGMSFRQSGICRGVQVLVQGHVVTEDFFPFELGSADLVLGISWLRTLGEVRADWDKFTMRFQHGSKWICWTGDPSLCYSPVSLRSLSRLWHHSGVRMLLELRTTPEGAVEGDIQPLPARCEQLIREFQPVFNMPVGLPPQRTREHCIVLRDGASPPNIRPYRYP